MPDANDGPADNMADLSKATMSDANGLLVNTFADLSNVSGAEPPLRPSFLLRWTSMNRPCAAVQRSLFLSNTPTAQVMVPKAMPPFPGAGQWYRCSDSGDEMEVEEEQPDSNSEPHAVRSLHPFSISNVDDSQFILEKTLRSPSGHGTLPCRPCRTSASGDSCKDSSDCRYLTTEARMQTESDSEFEPHAVRSLRPFTILDAEDGQFGHAHSQRDTRSASNSPSRSCYGSASSLMSESVVLSHWFAVLAADRRARTRAGPTTEMSAAA